MFAKRVSPVGFIGPKRFHQSERRKVFFSGDTGLGISGSRQIPAAP